MNITVHARDRETQKIEFTDAQPFEEAIVELIDGGGTPPWIITEDECVRFQDDFGHSYVYIITGYDPERHTYSLRWPD